MRRPSPEVAWTLALVLLLASIGAALLALGGPGDPTTAPQQPAPSATTPGAEPPPTTSSAPPTRHPTATRPAAPSPPPLPTSSTCVDLSEDTAFRVLTLNVHSGFGPGSGFDVGRIARYIRRWRIDVALLQEVDRFRRRSRYLDMPRVLAQQTGMEVAFGNNVRRGPRSQYGVATLSRFPITLRRNTHLPKRPGFQQRGLLRTDLDVAGTTVSVFNTHLDHLSTSMRIRQLAAVRPLVRAVDHPVVLGGDLNATPDSAVLALARTFVRDAWADAGSGPGRTGPALAPRRRIDYLTYTPPLVVTHAEVMPVVISDHRAVRARFVLSTVDDEVCVPDLEGPIDQGGTGGG
jgi:endonuclease/exonuclease/phosphatase family metal-dependent hydrolase